MGEANGSLLMSPQEKKDEKAPSKLVRFFLIDISAAASETVTYPIDYVKTRMQLATHRVGPITTLTNAVKEGGIRTLYRGLPASVLRHWVYTGIRISLYEQLRASLLEYNTAHSKTPLPEGEKAVLPFWQKCVIGASAGGVGQLFATPTDLVKVRVISDRQFKGVVHCVKHIWAKEGARGFAVGCGPNVLRASLVNLGELSSYDHSKQLVLKFTGLKDGLMVHLLSAICSGFVSTVVSCPADVLKTRMMSGKYTSIAKCLSQTAKDEGFRAFYKGFFPTWARLGPWQLVFWVTYESCRKLGGYSGF
eukprot:NODE_658_length_1266_cov_550.525062_g521_i0.p2 GENE.NODE_658_length_1266_cov_550.525062_g521_i0~~NODE_658_length_1266_cov_550.525062_g521_i0.p2  ORF type:complete len:306 (+),score=37.82 NODE_658_length_1266_cov_550.525062_g521_i0:31-948(+)